MLIICSPKIDKQHRVTCDLFGDFRFANLTQNTLKELATYINDNIKEFTSDGNIYVITDGYGFELYRYLEELGLSTIEKKVKPFPKARFDDEIETE